MAREKHDLEKVLPKYGVEAKSYVEVLCPYWQYSGSTRYETAHTIRLEKGEALSFSGLLAEEAAKLA